MKFDSRFESLKNKYSLILFVNNLINGCSRKIEKIFEEMLLSQEKKKTELKFNPGLALICLWTFGPKIRAVYSRYISSFLARCFCYPLIKQNIIKFEHALYILAPGLAFYQLKRMFTLFLWAGSLCEKIKTCALVFTHNYGYACGQIMVFNNWNSVYQKGSFNNKDVIKMIHYLLSLCYVLGKH